MFFSFALYCCFSEHRSGDSQSSELIENDFHMKSSHARISAVAVVHRTNFKGAEYTPCMTLKLQRKKNSLLLRALRAGGRGKSRASKGVLSASFEQVEQMNWLSRASRASCKILKYEPSERSFGGGLGERASRAGVLGSCTPLLWRFFSTMVQWKEMFTRIEMLLS